MKPFAVLVTLAALSGLTACSSGASGPSATPAATPVTLSALDSIAASGSTVAAPPPLRPMAMSGPLVYDGRRSPTDSGIRHVATYVNVHGAWVIADARGTIWREPPNRTASVIGHFQGPLTLLTDPEASHVAWVNGTTDPGRVLHVVDSRTGRSLLTTPMPRRSSLLAVDAEAAYVVDRTPRLLRISYANGDTTVVPVRRPLDVEDVVDEHVFVFKPFGGSLVPVSGDASRLHVPVAVDHLGPGLRYGASAEGDDVRDLATGTRVPIHVPAAANEKVTFYGWLGPSAVAFQKYDVAAGRWNVYACDLTAVRCDAALTRLPARLIGPGGWTPPLED